MIAEIGTCDTCGDKYPLWERGYTDRGYRCGDCGDCDECCKHEASDREDGEIPDRTIRQNGPQVIGERCPWCGAEVLDSDHSRSHD
jgi:ssDNA-binding Zn-finger/Zn-ribbon topoisomerase 1